MCFVLDLIWVGYAFCLVFLVVRLFCVFWVVGGVCVFDFGRLLFGLLVFVLLLCVRVVCWIVVI